MAQPSSMNSALEVDGLKTDFFNPTVHKYLSDKDFPKELVQQKSALELAESIVSHPQFSATYRNGMSDEILRQYADSNIELESNSPVAQNIELLRKQNTLTLTTGQQIHVFLGPMFVLNKILSCVAETNDTSSRLANYKVVPVFWMATEDHDFDEIRSVRLYNEHLNWDIESEGPVGRLSPNTLLPVLEAARNRIDQTETNLKFIDICEDAYRNSNTFAQATRKILHNYFEDTGIVILDADSRFFKNQLVDNIKADLFDHSNSSEIDQSIAKMKEAGIKAPINTRPINYFMIDDSSRKRIERHGEEFHVLGGKTYSQTEIQSLLDNSPEVFSPNALLRPVYQQLILPNIGYVAGGSEFIYWLELKRLMNSKDIPFPTLYIRKSVFFLSDKNRLVLEQENAELHSLFLNGPNFEHFFVKKTNSDSVMLQEKIDRIERDFDDVVEHLEGQLKRPLKGLRKQIQKAQLSLKNETDSTLVDDIRSQNSFKRVDKIKSKVWNKDYVQERNKDLISGITELEICRNHFKMKPNQFTNASKIVLLIT